MGGSIVIRMLANGNITFKKAVIDAGITPYQLPSFLSNMFALRDFSFMMLLKSSLKFLSIFVSKERYGSGTFDRLHKVMLHASTKTICTKLVIFPDFLLTPPFLYGILISVKVTIIKNILNVCKGEML